MCACVRILCCRFCKITWCTDSLSTCPISCVTRFMRYRRKQSAQIISGLFAESAACGCVLFLTGWVGPVTMKKKKEKKQFHVLDSDLETKQLPLLNFFFSFSSWSPQKIVFVLQSETHILDTSFPLLGSALGNKTHGEKVPEIKDWWTLVSLST